jgi:hypothetical protein
MILEKFEISLLLNTSLSATGILPVTLSLPAKGWYICLQYVEPLKVKNLYVLKTS